jgi:predicted transcriptional regulator
MMGEVMFPVVAKLKWQDQMAFDSDLSPTDFRIGFAIGWAINKRKGYALISQDKLAVKLALSVRTVQRSVDNLERRGHLRVHRRSLGTRKSDGRRLCGGRFAHRYEPIVKSGTPTRSVPPTGSTTNAATKDDSCVEKGRHGRRPFPLDPVYYPKKGPANARDDRGSLGGPLPVVLDSANRIYRPRGTEFELWLADQVNCEHSTIIDQVRLSSSSLCSAAIPLVRTLVKNSPNWPPRLRQSDTRRNRNDGPCTRESERRRPPSNPKAGLQDNNPTPPNSER